MNLLINSLHAHTTSYNKKRTHASLKKGKGEKWKIWGCTINKNKMKWECNLEEIVVMAALIFTHARSAFRTSDDDAVFIFQFFLFPERKKEVVCCAPRYLYLLSAVSAALQLVAILLSWWKCVANERRGKRIMVIIVLSCSCDATTT